MNYNTFDLSNFKTNYQKANLEIKDSYTKKRTYKKIEDNFVSGKGICYIDTNNIEYTKEDLIESLRTSIGIEELFKELAGSTPEDTLENSWLFSKCKFCGTYLLKNNIFSRETIICPNCTPLLTRGVISLTENPYEDDRKFYNKRKITFEEGVTTLVGCNGSGKSTIINNIETYLKTKGVPCIKFDNLAENGGEKSYQNLFEKSLMGGAVLDKDEEPFLSIEYAVGLSELSEGERIRESLRRFTYKLVRLLNEYCKIGYGEYWILFDALDSGLSVDILEDIKEQVFNRLVELYKDKIKLYLIISSNSYEISENTKCFSVGKLRYININSYKSFKKEILLSKEYKEKRDIVFIIKDKIHTLDEEFYCDDNLLKAVNDWRLEKIKGKKTVAKLTKYDYTIELVVKVGRDYSLSRKFIIYDKNDKNYKCQNSIDRIRFNKDSLVQDMREILEEIIFKEISKNKDLIQKFSLKE